MICRECKYHRVIDWEYYCKHEQSKRTDPITGYTTHFTCTNFNAKGQCTVGEPIPESPPVKPEPPVPTAALNDLVARNSIFKGDWVVVKPLHERIADLCLSIVTAFKELLKGKL